MNICLSNKELVDNRCIQIHLTKDNKCIVQSLPNNIKLSKVIQNNQITKQIKMKILILI